MSQHQRSVFLNLILVTISHYLRSCLKTSCCVIGSKDSELLWLENPDNHSYKTVWNEHVITHGPDVYFKDLKIATPDGTFDVIVTTEFFTRKLSIHWTTDPSNKWADSSKVDTRFLAFRIIKVL